LVGEGGVAGVRVLSAEALEVDRDRGQDVLNVDLGGPVVAAATHLMGVDDLVDGALDAGAGVVETQPVEILLVGAVLGLDLVQMPGQEVDRAGRGSAGAAGPLGAWGAVVGVEAGHQVGAIAGAWTQLPVTLPFGQVTVRLSKSMVKSSRAKPVCCLRCRFGPRAASGPTGSVPCARAVASMTAAEV
jgi:hypothetical protein